MTENTEDRVKHGPAMISRAFDPMTAHMFAPPITEVSEAERTCFICNEPIKVGDTILQDATEGIGHRACFGNDREGFVKDIETGEPLGANDPLPGGEVWTEADAQFMREPDRRAAPPSTEAEVVAELHRIANSADGSSAGAKAALHQAADLIASHQSALQAPVVVSDAMVGRWKGEVLAFDARYGSHVFGNEYEHGNCDTRQEEILECRVNTLREILAALTTSKEPK